METESFLAEFPPVSTEQWEHAIRESVAGPDYPAKLIWHPEEGLTVHPYYRAEDIAGLTFLNSAPGEFPYVRGTRTNGDWRIRERIDSQDPEEANQAACDAVADGAEEIAFSGITIGSASDVTLLLANLNEIPVHFGGGDYDSTRILVDRLKSHARIAPISMDLNPLDDLDFSAELIRTAPTGLKLFVIQADHLLERGAGAIEEIGFSISAAADFLDEMQNCGVSIDRAAASLGFLFAIGPGFFVQIAKLRAFRLLWSQIVESFGGNRESARTSVNVRTSRWDQTIYDPHVNILRATTEAISAVLGCADSIQVAAFDDCYKQPDKNSRRLARNTQLILKREAHLSQVADPVGGSYLIEFLTNSIATKAWKLFQDLEAAGGYRKALAEGVLDSVLERREQARKQSFDYRRLVLTGTNRFANPAEKALDRVDNAPAETADRVARGFEELRLRTERAAVEGKSLQILLAEIGDAKMRTARSQFAADFLACAGLSAQVTWFDNVEQIAGSEADLIVLCSSDAEYLPIAERLMPLVKFARKTCVFVAGNPVTVEQLKALGIAEFIHLRSNARDVLSRIQKLTGIEA
jgi:methylmalonyl-CoA mutase